MSEQLDHKTFDLISVLAGRAYPTLDVSVYFNEELGFKLFQLERDRREALLLDADNAKDLDKEFQALSKASEDEKFTVTLKSIPEQVRRDVISSVASEFPAKRNMIGQEDPNPEGDQALTKKLWSVYIQAVTDPDGAVSIVTEETVDSIYNLAPIGVHKAINVGIGELQGGADAGFEAAAKELDFLSAASPEG